MSEVGKVPISELRSKVVTVEPRISGAAVAEEEALRPLLVAVRPSAIEFASTHQAQPWLLDALKNERHIDGIVAEMRHVAGGQNFFLTELQKLQPDLKWYRGGTLTKWKDEIGSASYQYFTPDQLDTYVIDGGQNGILGQPSTALNFLRLSPRPRPNPAFYTLTLSDLMQGLQADAISLGSEHFYDLNVNRGNNVRAYLDFCRKNLKIQQVVLD